MCVLHSCRPSTRSAPSRVPPRCHGIQIIPTRHDVYQVQDIDYMLTSGSTAVLHCTYIQQQILCIMYHVYSTEKNSRHMTVQWPYGEHWGIIAFPTCSWRVESGPKQGRLEAVRYSLRPVPTRLGWSARLYRTSSGNVMMLLVPY